jgi:glycosyltransferase involved in cell wall biosynthesis
VNTFGARTSGPFSIAQVTPYPWDGRRDVNEYVERVSEALADRGHAVLLVAPSASRSLVRESRRLIRAAASSPERLLEPGKVRVLAVGQSLPVGAPRRGGTVSVPIDTARTVERLLAAAPLDFVHVHEPFAPSVSATALRHSRALNIGTFHSPTERVLSTQVGRRFVELFFGRLDARTSVFDMTRELVSRFFPGDYEVVPPGVDLESFAPARGSGDGVEIAFAATEERAARRLFLRALRRLPPADNWRATVWSPERDEPPLRIGRALRDRVRLVTQPTALQDLLARADVACLASSGAAPSGQLLLKAIACGAVPVCARVSLYEELLGQSDEGLFFEPGDVTGLTERLTRLVEDDGLRRSLAERCLARRPELGWDRVAESFDGIYGRLAARRHSPPASYARTARRLSGRKFIFCDLHMHTDHSPDCATPVDVLLDAARWRGLGAIAVTDHNEISGALEARERANGIKVIVSEEVKTADEGEVIGLFIEEKIPPGMSMEKTIDAIHGQGGLAYVPHPFDRLRSVPDYEHLLKVVDRIDILEVFNAHVAVPAFNEEAARFAAKYAIVAGAGSDSHVAQGLGRVKIRMRDFDGPEEFLESLRDADILRKRKSLIYLQSLKLLQRARPRSTRSRSARAARR